MRDKPFGKIISSDENLIFENRSFNLRQCSARDAEAQRRKTVASFASRARSEYSDGVDIVPPSAEHPVSLSPHFPAAQVICIRHICRHSLWSSLVPLSARSDHFHALSMFNRVNVKRLNDAHEARGERSELCAVDRLHQHSVASLNNAWKFNLIRGRVKMNEQRRARRQRVIYQQRSASVVLLVSIESRPSDRPFLPL